MYKINYRDFGWNILAGEFVIYSLDQNTYYRFNDVGKEIWEIMCAHPQGIAVEAIVRLLSEQYNCSLEQLHHDILAFLNQLTEIGAVINT